MSRSMYCTDSNLASSNKFQQPLLGKLLLWVMCRKSRSTCHTCSSSGELEGDHQALPADLLLESNNWMPNSSRQEEPKNLYTER